MTLADRYDSFLFDLDGVLYRANRPVEGAADAIRSLRAARRGIAFVTNNSAKAPEQVADTLAALGIQAASEEIVTSAIATAELIGRRGGGTAFVIGETGIRKALTDAGIEVLEGSPSSADWVVVGWDRGADYDKLRTAALLVERGAALVATNADAAYPAPEGAWPGAGALLAVVTTTTSVVPEVVGKPHAPLFRTAVARAGGRSHLFIGDRIDTDVVGAEALGIPALLVFTGVSAPADLTRADGLPTYVGRDLSALFREHPSVRPATAADERAVTELLHSTGLQDEGAARRIGDTLVAELAGEVIGTVALDVDAGRAHLRSLAVRERSRGTFVGTLLVAHAVLAAREAGASKVFLATETAAGFFGRLSELPERFRQGLPLCSETAETMRLAL